MEVNYLLIGTIIYLLIGILIVAYFWIEDSFLMCHTLIRVGIPFVLFYPFWLIWLGYDKLKKGF